MAPGPTRGRLTWIPESGRVLAAWCRQERVPVEWVDGPFDLHLREVCASEFSVRGAGRRTNDARGVLLLASHRGAAADPPCEGPGCRSNDARGVLLLSSHEGLAVSKPVRRGWV